MLLRNYQPRTGQWTSLDPFGLNRFQSPYIYVNANPANNIDPTGLDVGIAPAANEWSFSYPHKPSNLSNMQLDYLWQIEQRFTRDKKLPDAWKGVPPTQTWQVNEIQAVLLIQWPMKGQKGKFFCEKIMTPFLYVEDIQEYPSPNVLTDYLAFSKLIGINKAQGAKLCYAYEVVKKSLGFNMLDSAGRNFTAPNIGTGQIMTDTDAGKNEIKQLRQMRGPYLFMRTHYVFVNNRWCNCVGCRKHIESELNGIPKYVQQPFPIGAATEFEAYTVFAGRQAREDLPLIKSWESIKSYF